MPPWSTSGRRVAPVFQPLVMLSVELLLCRDWYQISPSSVKDPTGHHSCSKSLSSITPGCCKKLKSRDDYSPEASLLHLRLTHTHTYTHTHTHSLSHTHKHTHTHSISLFLSHTHSHTQLKSPHPPPSDRAQSESVSLCSFLRATHKQSNGFFCFPRRVRGLLLLPPLTPLLLLRISGSCNRPGTPAGRSLVCQPRSVLPYKC